MLFLFLLIYFNFSRSFLYLSYPSQTFLVTCTTTKSEFSSFSLSVTLQNWSNQIYTTLFFISSLPSYCAVLSFVLFISECTRRLSYNFSFVWGLRSCNASFIGIPCGLLATSLVFFCFILAFILMLQSAKVAQTSAILLLENTCS